MEKYFNINNSGFSIRCKLYYGDIKNINKVVIYGHGFGGHKDNKAAQRFAEYVLKKHKDIEILTFNAPCHGDDARKTLLLKECDEYIQAVTNYALKQYKTNELFVYATSFGGYQFLKYISEHGNPYKKLALRCPAVNMYNVLSDRIMSDDEQKALARNKPVFVGFDRKIKVTQRFLDDLRKADISSCDFTKYSEDILILHGTKDEVVPFDFVREFSENNGIRFIKIEDADHRFKDTVKMDTAIKNITSFFEF